MNKEVIKRWIKALRSGDYVQNQGCLRKHNTFCVLGVICDLHAKEFGNEWKPRTEPFTVPGVKKYLGTALYLPEEVASWFMMHGYRELGIMNDSGSSFNELADYIETRMNSDSPNLWRD